MKPECPQCHADAARRILPSGPVERLLDFLSIRSFRCQLCAHRFRRPALAVEHGLLLSDQRQFERLPTSVRAIIAGAQEHEDVITDLSMGGCTLRTTTPLTKGTFLHLGVKASADEPPIMVETAMVRSVRRETVGLQFLEFEETQKERLGRFIGDLLLARRTASVAG